MVFLKRIWKHSILRFYILNTMWNYKFWLHAKKTYKKIDFFEETGDCIDTYAGITSTQKKVSKNRFVGYFYKNGIFLDNPGLKIEDRETWLAWRRKGLIK